MGTNSNQGMLLKGFSQVSQSGTQVIGQKVYASTVPGIVQGSAPSGDGDVARVLGYAINTGTSNGSVSIYFNPDNTWIELSV